MKSIFYTAAAAALFASVGLAQGNSGQHRSDDGTFDIYVHGNNPHGAGAPTAGSTGVVTPAITYKGGALIGTPKIYYIWYGNWNQSNGSDNAAGQSILTDLATSIGGSPHYLLNTTYSAGSYTITGNATWGGATSDAYSQGTRLRDSSVLAIVNNALNKGMAYDPNGIYFVLSSSDVNESSGFCTKYCGWHTAGNSVKGRVRYSFVGNANRCLNACSAQTVGPNGNAGVDAMASVLVHELEEANTDPEPGSGWTDANGAENADKCAWTFGQSQTRLASGAYYNMTLGTRNFLIQRNLKHATTGDTCNVTATQQ